MNMSPEDFLSMTVASVRLGQKPPAVDVEECLRLLILAKWERLGFAKELEKAHERTLMQVARINGDCAILSAYIGSSSGG